MTLTSRFLRVALAAHALFAQGYSLKLESASFSPSVSLTSASTEVDVRDISNGPPTITISGASSPTVKFIAFMVYHYQAVVQGSADAAIRDDTVTQWTWAQTNLTQGDGGKLGNSTAPVASYQAAQFNVPSVKASIEVWEQTPELEAALPGYDINNPVSTSKFFEAAYRFVRDEQGNLRLDNPVTLTRSFLDIQLKNSTGDPNAPRPTITFGDPDATTSTSASSSATSTNTTNGTLTTPTLGATRTSSSTGRGASTTSTGDSNASASNNSALGVRGEFSTLVAALFAVGAIIA